MFNAKWFGKGFFFCDQCTRQLTHISELQGNIQELERKLKDCEQEVKNKLEGSETGFERRSVCLKDERYFKLRKQILGGSL